VDLAPRRDDGYDLTDELLAVSAAQDLAANPRQRARTAVDAWAQPSGRFARTAGESWTPG